MRRPTPAAGWPDSWRLSHEYDRLEVYGERHHRGYAYAYAARWTHTLDLVRQAARPPATVLDIAAAQGNFSLALAEAGYRVTWNDLREDLAGYVRLKHEHGEIEYRPGDVFSLDLSQQFDIVLMTEVIEHVAHPDSFLARVASFVVPGGHVVVTTPNGGYFRNTLPRFSDCADPAVYEARQFQPNADGHIFLLHDDELADLAGRAGLETRNLRLFATPLTCGHLGSEPLLHWLPRAVVSGVESFAGRLPWAWRCGLCVQMAALLRRPNAR